VPPRMPEHDPAARMRSQQGGGAEPGLLVVRSRVLRPLHAEYHAWYDNQHVPARIRLPGWLTARRYAAADDAESFLAYYDLADLAVLRRPPYLRMREQRPATEQRILNLIRPMDRRVYRRIDVPGGRPPGPPDELGTCGALLLCVWWQPAPGATAQFNDWYRQEHIPMLSRVPGWLRSRRFELVDGGGPSFLGMHDLASADVFDHPDYARATSTSRRAAVVAQRAGYERVLYRLLRRFDTDH
jgi:hypothetical protein